MAEDRFELQISNPTFSRTFTNLTKKNIGEFLRDIIGIHYFEIWAERSTQGRTVRLTGKSKLSSQFMVNATLPERVMKFVILARNNLLDLKYKPMNINGGHNTRCRNCGYEKETIEHMLHMCPARPTAKYNKHNTVLRAVAAYLEKIGFNVDIEKPFSDIDPLLIPDLAIIGRDNKTIHILDIKVPFDSETKFEEHRIANRVKYWDLARRVGIRNNCKTNLDAIVIGSLGSWDTENESPLKKLGLTKTEVEMLANEAVNAALTGSYHIYKDHLNQAC